MNSCVLMVEIITEPELRQTTDNLEVSNMTVEFPGLRSEDPSARIRAVGWGSLATEINEKYHAGDRIIIEGRLGMNTIEMKEGYKEKRAELVISRIVPLGSSSTGSYASTPSQSPKVVDLQPTPQPTAPQPVNTVTEYASTTSVPSNTVDSTETRTPGNYTNEELDDIPFMRPVYSKTSLGKILCDSWELAANSYWDGIKQ